MALRQRKLAADRAENPLPLRAFVRWGQERSAREGPRRTRAEPARSGSRSDSPGGARSVHARTQARNAGAPRTALLLPRLRDLRRLAVRLPLKRLEALLLLQKLSLCEETSGRLGRERNAATLCRELPSEGRARPAERACERELLLYEELEVVEKLLPLPIRERVLLRRTRETGGGGNVSLDAPERKDAGGRGSGDAL